MNIIKDLNDLPSNIFGFRPEGLSLAEENIYLGKAIIELQNIRTYPVLISFFFSN